MNDSNDRIRTSRSACVVGAGVAGLVTAKTLLADGFAVTVLERDPTIGGNWAPCRTYPGLRANNSRRTYEFSDFPFPDHVDEFPTAAQIRAWLDAYADHFDLRACIQLNREVIDIARSETGLVVTHRGRRERNAPAQIQRYDFVVICNGVYHVPRLPELADRERFVGRVVHSSQVTEDTFDDHDRVVVVGAGKSAMDCAAWASTRAASTTLLFRRPHWMAPRYLPGGLPGDRLLMSRFMSGFLAWHGDTGRPTGLNRLLGRAWWALLTRRWPTELAMPTELVPEEPLPLGLEQVGVGGELYDAVNTGRANAVRGRISRFLDTGLELEDGRTVTADVVIFATGWQQEVGLLSDELRAAVRPDGRFRLYHHILPPAVPNLGFIGYATSFATQFTAEIGAHWLSEHFLGALALPDRATMEARIDEARDWADRALENRSAEGFIGPYVVHYIDDLVREMGLSTRRSANPLAERFGSYLPRRFRGLGKERQRLRMARESTSPAGPVPEPRVTS